MHAPLPHLPHVPHRRNVSSAPPVRGIGQQGPRLRRPPEKTPQWARQLRLPRSAAPRGAEEVTPLGSAVDAAAADGADKPVPIPPSTKPPSYVRPKQGMPMRGLMQAVRGDEAARRAEVELDWALGSDAYKAHIDRLAAALKKREQQLRRGEAVLVVTPLAPAPPEPPQQTSHPPSGRRESATTVAQCGGSPRSPPFDPPALEATSTAADAQVPSPSQLQARARRLVLRGFMRQWERLLADESDARRRLVTAMSTTSGELRRSRLRKIDSLQRLRMSDPKSIAAARLLQKWQRQVRIGQFGKRRLRQELFHLRFRRAKEEVVGSAKNELLQARRDLVHAQEVYVREEKREQREQFGFRERDLRQVLNTQEEHSWKRLFQRAKWGLQNINTLVLLADVEGNEETERLCLLDDAEIDLLELCDDQHRSRLITEGPCRQAVASIEEWWLLCRAGVYGRIGFRRRLAFELRMAREQRLVSQKREISSYVDQMQSELLDASAPEERDEVLARVTRNRAHRRRKLQEWETISKNRVASVLKSLDRLADLSSPLQQTRGAVPVLRVEAPVTCPQGRVPISTPVNQALFIEEAVPVLSFPASSVPQTDEQREEDAEETVRAVLASLAFTETKGRAAVELRASNVLALHGRERAEQEARMKVKHAEDSARSIRVAIAVPLLARCGCDAEACRAMLATRAEQKQQWESLGDSFFRSLTASVEKSALVLRRDEGRWRSGTQADEVAARTRLGELFAGGGQSVHLRDQRGAVESGEAEARDDLAFEEAQDRRSTCTLYRRAALRLLQRAEQLRRGRTAQLEQVERAQCDFPGCRSALEQEVARLQQRAADEAETESILRTQAVQRRGREQQELDRRCLVEVREDAERGKLVSAAQMESDTIICAMRDELQREESEARAQAAAEEQAPRGTWAADFSRGARLADAARTRRCALLLEALEVRESNARGRLVSEEDAVSWQLYAAFDSGLVTPERVLKNFQQREANARLACEAHEIDQWRAVRELLDEYQFRDLRQQCRAAAALEAEIRADIDSEQDAARVAVEHSREQRADRLARMIATRTPQRERPLRPASAGRQEDAARRVIEVEEQAVRSKSVEEAKHAAVEAERAAALRLLSQYSAGVGTRVNATLVCEYCGQRFAHAAVAPHKVSCQDAVRLQMLARGLDPSVLHRMAQTIPQEEASDAARQAYNDAAYDAWRCNIARHRIWVLK